ncbi:hypothetical protein G9A89_014369 [Geosiphon pyriformis]|nr:hypothetical protein G9A89_014369 [Geosiphon pyriformis]
MGAYIGDNKEWFTTTKNYCRPYASETICHASHVMRSCLMKDSEMMCLAEEKHRTSIKDAWKQALNRLDSYPHDNYKIWKMASTKAKDTMSEEIQEIKNNFWMPKYNEFNYSMDDFFTNDSDAFQNQYQELAPTCEEQEQSLVKKGIDIKKGIINACYTGNIIIILQNNSDRFYKIELQEKIAQAIFLPLVKISQLILVTTQEELGLTVQEINRFGSSGRENIPVNFTEEDSDQVEFIYTDTIISIPPYQQYIFKSIPDFTQLFLFCNITSQVWNLPKESYLFIPEKINKLNLENLSTLQQMQLKVFRNQYADVFASKNEFRHTNIVKHQIDMEDARLIKQ